MKYQSGHPFQTMPRGSELPNGKVQVYLKEIYVVLVSIGRYLYSYLEG